MFAPHKCTLFIDLLFKLDLNTVISPSPSQIPQPRAYQNNCVLQRRRKNFFFFLFLYWRFIIKKPRAERLGISWYFYRNGSTKNDACMPVWLIQWFLEASSSLHQNNKKKLASCWETFESQKSHKNLKTAFAVEGGGGGVLSVSKPINCTESKSQFDFIISEIFSARTGSRCSILISWRRLSVFMWFLEAQQNSADVDSCGQFDKFKPALTWQQWHSVTSKAAMQTVLQ